ncbi:hypothetical protein GW17_00061194 [Ensete ventricosum]|nr:hypothetical protein GW17_00061194 [Ensete ventricosum]
MTVPHNLLPCVEGAPERPVKGLPVELWGKGVHSTVEKWATNVGGPRRLQTGLVGSLEGISWGHSWRADMENYCEEPTYGADIESCCGELTFGELAYGGGIENFLHVGGEHRGERTTFPVEEVIS